VDHFPVVQGRTWIL